MENWHKQIRSIKRLMKRIIDLFDFPNKCSLNKN